jgi:hypothetical protein
MKEGESNEFSPLFLKREAMEISEIQSVLDDLKKRLDHFRGSL